MTTQRMKSLIGLKSAMTQIWDDKGKRLPVTIIKTSGLVVTQIKTVAKDGYDAVQLGLASKPAKRLTKPITNHLKAVIVEDKAPRYLKEIRLPQAEDVKIGQALNVADIVSVGDRITVAGITKGRGFAGAIKRHGFKGGPKTHGQSDRHRAVGAIGQGTSPGRIHKGKRMPGHYGVERVSVKHLTVLKVESNELWVSGPVPGYRGALVEISVV